MPVAGADRRTVVFQHAVSQDPPGAWIHEHVDLDTALAGKERATIAFRVTDPSNLAGVLTDVGVDDLQGDGFSVVNPGFETPDSWTLSRTAGPFLPVLDIFDAQRPVHVFAAIRDLFAGASAPSSPGEGGGLSVPAVSVRSAAEPSGVRAVPS